MKISIITVSFNSEKTIRKTIESVLNQNYGLIEYIIVDGKSQDNTLSIINSFSKKIDKIISEKDFGMYDAINKGIKLATGDVIGILNSDDEFFDDKIVSSISKKFKNSDNLDAVIGDVVFQNNSKKIIRKYSSSKWNPNKFVWGFMPPHPSFYCRKKHFIKYGLYRTDFKIAADYELLIRFLKVNKLNYEYLPINFVKMKLGGKSTKNLRSNLIINQEIIKACEINGIKSNYFKLYSKYFIKIFELINFKKISFYNILA